jgi:GNAT superfamily N-acetyltransferase
MNTPTIQFAVAAPSDREALATLRIEAMRESLERIGRFDPVRARERFLVSFAPEQTRHVIVDGERVGFFVVKRSADGLVLDHLYIHPRHQRKGIGALVLAQVFAEADFSGQSVRVGALRGSRSNQFYVRHGFTQIEQGEFDNYYVRASKPHAP